jgi:ABC-type molybdate transport system ATPase subunit
MSIKQRKLGFYSLRVFTSGDLDTSLKPEPLHKLLKGIERLPEERRIRLITDKNKMQMLAEIYEHTKFSGVVFESSKYRHRPPLLNIKGRKRDNPKTLEEGDAERTHVGFRFLSREAIMVLEERKSGLTAKMIHDYLSYFLRLTFNKQLPYILSLSVIAKGTFQEELRKMARVKVGTVIVEKRLLGDEGIEFSNRTKRSNVISR